MLKQVRPSRLSRSSWASGSLTLGRRGRRSANKNAFKFSQAAAVASANSSQMDSRTGMNNQRRATTLWLINLNGPNSYQKDSASRYSLAANTASPLTITDCPQLLVVDEKINASP